MRATGAVVLVIDRLGAGWLGPYGNTWLDTPNFNRLAAQSLLFETAISDSPALEVAYRSLWTGQHALVPDAAANGTLTAHARRAGLPSTLLTDDSEVANGPLAGEFATRRVLAPLDAATCAESVEQTGLFAFFDAARLALQQSDGPGLLWLHARGMAGPWDGPLELRYQFADEDDPAPPTLAEPPNRQLPEGFDPDEQLGYVQAYAGQVALADMCLGMFLDALDAHPLAAQTLLVVTSPRGYPLGEHRRVGPCDEALYGELLHVPLIVRLPGAEPTRLHRIVQPADVQRLIARACGWLPADASEPAHEEHWGNFGERSGAAYAVGRAQRAIRTPAWFLRESSDSGQPRYELFAKPDDRWEANEVSSLCGEAVELLAAELQRFQASAAAGQLAETPPLAELLCDIWR